MLQLIAFMRSVPLLWTWSELADLARTGGTVLEQRGPDHAHLSFQLVVLDRNRANDEEYLHVGVNVSDAARDSAARGNAWMPLSTSFLWYASGSLDMPCDDDLHRDLAEA